MKLKVKILLAGAAALVSAVAYATYYYTAEPDDTNEVDDPNNDSLPAGNAVPSQTNFKIDEYNCHDGTPVPQGLYGNVQANMDNLQVLRNAIGLPIIIVSGFRTPTHNAAVGGAPHSCHLKGMASDIKVPGMSPAAVRAQIETLIASGAMSEGGLGAYSTFTHYDVRGTKARWNG